MQMRNRLIIASLLVVSGHVPVVAGTAVAVDSERGSPSAEGFVILASNLAEEGSQGMATRQRLAEQAEERFLSAVSDCRAISPSQWSSLTDALGGDMSARAKIRWKHGLRMAFLGEELTDEAILSLRSALDALDDEDGGGFVSDWMEAHDSWQSWEPGGLTALAEALEGESERARLGRLRLAELVTTRYLAYPTATRSVSPEQWQAFCQAFGKDIPTEWRTEWVMWLYDAYVKRTSTAEQIETIALAAQALGDPTFSAIVGAWAHQIDSLESVTTGDLVTIVDRFQYEFGQMKRIATEIERRHFVDDVAIRSVSCEDWWYLTRKFRRAFFDQTKSAWAKKLSLAFLGEDLTVDEVVNMDNVMNELTLTGWGWLRPGGFVDDWMASTDHWQSWPVGDLAKLGERLRLDVPSEKAARQAMAAYVTTEHFADDSDVLSVDCHDWLAIAKAFSSDLSAEDRARWIRKLRAGFMDRDINGERLAAIVDSLRHLGDGDCVGFVADWLANTNRWRSWPAKDCLHVAKSVRGSSDSASRARRTIAEQFASRHMAEGETIRSVGLGQWAEIAKAVGQDLPAGACISWASRILAGYQDDRYALCDRDFNALGQCLRYLGAAEMFSLLADDRRRYRPESRALLGRKPEESLVWRDAAWQRLCWRTIAAPPGQRGDVWLDGLQQLSDDVVFPSENVLGALDDLTTALGESKSGVLSPVDVLTGLLAISQEYSLRQSLRSRLNNYELRRHWEVLPPRLSEIVRRLPQLEEEGKTDEAVSACAELVKESDDLGVGQAAVSVMRRKLLSFLLERESTDFGLCRRQLAALASSGHCRSDQQWNLACQLLFKEVAEEDPADRRNLWNRGIAGLPDSDEGVCIFETTFTALDRLIGQLKVEDPAMVHVVLCDLLLVAPDLPSMYRVQQRRLAAFMEGQGRQGTEAAAALQAMIASATAEGPLDAFGLGIEADTVAASGAEAGTLSLWRAESEGRDNGQGEAASTEIMDPLLRNRAQEIVQTGLTGATPRRKAYIHLFAGDVPAALRSVHGALAETKGNPTEICTVLDDVSLILSVADRQIVNADRFSLWVAGRPAEPTDGQGAVPSVALLWTLVECEAGLNSSDAEDAGGRAADEPTYAGLPKAQRQALAGKHLARRAQRLVRWSVDALREGQVKWSARFIAAAVNCAGDPPDSHGIVDDIVSRIGDLENAESAMVAGAREVHCDIGRRLLLYRAAQRYYKKAAFAQCLECLDSADSAVAGKEEPRDLDLAMLRAVSLIGLDRHAEGLKMLDDARQWPAASQQQGQVAFLTGWAHLAGRDADKALQAFEQGIAKYPDTSFACEARRIVNQLRETGSAEAPLPHVGSVQQ